MLLTADKYLLGHCISRIHEDVYSSIGRAWVRGMEPQEQTLMRTKKTSQRLDMREDLAHFRSVNLKSSRWRLSCAGDATSMPSPLVYDMPCACKQPLAQRAFHLQRWVGAWHHAEHCGPLEKAYLLLKAGRKAAEKAHSLSQHRSEPSAPALTRRVVPWPGIRRYAKARE